jgi:hypothetical protein
MAFSFSVSIAAFLIASILVLPVVAAPDPTTSILIINILCKLCLRLNLHKNCGKGVDLCPSLSGRTSILNTLSRLPKY